MNKIPMHLMCVLCVIALNVVAHFIPFERAAIGNDDFAHWSTSQQFTVQEVLARTPRQQDRPLTYLTLMLQERWMAGDPVKGLWSVVLVTSAVAVGVYCLLALLCDDRRVGLLGALLFIVLPQKAEVYHIPVYAVYDIANVLYISSMIAFWKFMQSEQTRWLMGSLLAYTIAILFYETGFFLPIVWGIFCYMHAKPSLRATCWFGLPAGLYLAFRFTRAFGLADPAPIHDHHASIWMLASNGVDLLHHYVGRYMARHVLYGSYTFTQISWPWLLLLVTINIGGAMLLVRWLRTIQRPHIPRPLWTMAGLLFVWTALPILLTSYGGVGGRQLVLPSIAVALALIAMMRWKYWRHVTVTVMVGLLIICQGTAWAHVVASRITGAVYVTFQHRLPELRSAERVIFDKRSLADRIPFTWVERDFNVLNTYYGVQALEDWGIASMLRVLLRDDTPPVYVTTQLVDRGTSRMVQVQVQDQTGYRAVKSAQQQLPRAGSLIIGYDEVYAQGYDYGRR